MEHISQIPILKKIPKLNREQANQVWQITDNLLPNDCRWRKNDKLSIEVLEIIGAMYLNNELTYLNKICVSCMKVHPEIYCFHRKNLIVL